MSYATVADMLGRFGETELRQLSDIDTPRTGAVVDAVVQRALDDASAWIDAYLLGRYTLPIADAGALAVLKMHCAAEARYLLMTAQADEAAVKAHDERIAFFTRVAKGEIVLIAPEAMPAATGVGEVLFDGGSKLFGRASYAEADE
jgi:phage gp36-like protein